MKRSLPNPAGDKAEGEVGTVILTLDSKAAKWRIGLPVTVRFEPCGSTDKPTP